MNFLKEFMETLSSEGEEITLVPLSEAGKSSVRLGVDDNLLLPVRYPVKDEDVLCYNSLFPDQYNEAFKGSVTTKQTEILKKSSSAKKQQLGDDLYICYRYNEPFTGTNPDIEQAKQDLEDKRLCQYNQPFIKTNPNSNATEEQLKDHKYYEHNTAFNESAALNNKPEKEVPGSVLSTGSKEGRPKKALKITADTIIARGKL
jgi:hypothetical protein